MADEIPYARKRVNRCGRALVALIMALSDVQGVTRRQHVSGVPADLFPVLIGCIFSTGEHLPSHFHFLD